MVVSFCFEIDRKAVFIPISSFNGGNEAGEAALRLHLELARHKPRPAVGDCALLRACLLHCGTMEQAMYRLLFKLSVKINAVRPLPPPNSNFRKRNTHMKFIL